MSFTDPTSYIKELESGMTPRKLINFAKAQGWPTRKIYGRLWISAEHYDAWLAQKQASQVAGVAWLELHPRQQNQAIGLFPTFNVCGKYHDEFLYQLDAKGNVASRSESV